MMTMNRCLVILCFLLLIISEYETYRRGSQIDLVDRINENHRLLKNDNAAPVAPTILTRQPQPVAPPMDVVAPPPPPTDAPVAPPVSDPATSSVTNTSPAPVVVSNNGPQSTAPVASPTRQQSNMNDYIVPLLSFTVSTSETNISKLARSLEDYLYNEMKNDIPDLLSIQLQNVSVRRRRRLLGAPPSSITSLNSIRTLLDKVSFSGAAFFATKPVPNALQVYASQERALTQDLSNEGISSLQLQTATTSTPGGNSSPKNVTAPLIAGVAAAAAIMLIVAVIVAYRYLKSSTTPSSSPSSTLPLSKMKKNKNNPYHDESSYETRESPAAAPPSEIISNMSVAQSDFDDYSLDGYSYVAGPPLDSAASSLAGMPSKETAALNTNPTQMYLANRLQQKQQMMPSRRQSNSFDDQSESEFSYGFVGNGNDVQADSDDDVFISDSIEVGMDDGNNNSFVRGSPMFRGKRQNETFDEESPFDEVKTAKPRNATTRPNATMAPTKAEEEARILANQLMYERDNDEPQDEQQLATLGGGSGEEEGDLTEFLRERRRAKRASRKQPPLSMEI